MTDQQKPEPMVAPDVDLRGYEFMPLYGNRLMASETWIAASAEAKVAALRLWWHAYGREVPAGTLPDNDNLLADYAGYGVALKAWKRVRNQAMRGWVLCTDGRWHHPFVAQLVTEAWEYRKSQRDRTEKARTARLSQKQSQTGKSSVTETATGLLQTPQDRTGQDSSTKNSSAHSTVPTPDPQKSARDEGQKSDPERQGTLRGIMARELREAGVNVTPSHPLLVAWVTKGVTIQIAREAIDLARDKKPKPEKIPPAYLDPIIAQLMNPEGAKSKVEAAAKRDWWTTESGIAAKAIELGIEIARNPDRVGEWCMAVRCAVAAKTGLGPWIDQRCITEMQIYEQFLKKEKGQ